MNSAINVREAELMEAIRINNSVIKQLEKENRELKEEYANFKKQVSEDMKEITKNQVENINLFDELEEENKELKEKYDGLWKIYTEDVNERIEANENLKELNIELISRIDMLEREIKIHCFDYCNLFKRYAVISVVCLLSLIGNLITLIMQWNY